MLTCAEGEKPITVGGTVGNPTPIALEDGGIDRSASTASTAAYRDMTPSRGGTLKKKTSVSRKSSLGRSGSRRSRAGSIAGVGTPGAREDYNSALSTPIPTHGSPTDILANCFQGMLYRLDLGFYDSDLSCSVAHIVEVLDHILP